MTNVDDNAERYPNMASRKVTMVEPTGNGLELPERALGNAMAYAREHPDEQVVFVYKLTTVPLKPEMGDKEREWTLGIIDRIDRNQKIIGNTSVNAQTSIRG